jgi:hypothetical protein
MMIVHVLAQLLKLSRIDCCAEAVDRMTTKVCLYAEAMERQVTSNSSAAAGASMAAARSTCRGTGKPSAPYSATSACTRL